jgi:large subunit ribosomal protein L10
LGLNMKEKQAAVAEISAEVTQAQAIVVAEYRGLEVAAMTDLRKKARGSGIYLRVLKNTLARRAVAATPFAGLSEKMVGPLAYGISRDPVKVAKVLHEFARGNDKFVIKAGAMPNFVMSPKDVANLAMLPSRDELIAKLTATMQAPIANLVRTLNELPARFVRTVAAVRDQKQQAA